MLKIITLTDTQWESVYNDPIQARRPDTIPIDGSKIGSKNCCLRNEREVQSNNYRLGIPRTSSSHRWRVLTADRATSYESNDRVNRAAFYKKTQTITDSICRTPTKIGSQEKKSIQRPRKSNLRCSSFAVFDNDVCLYGLWCTTWTNATNSGPRWQLKLGWLRLVVVKTDISTIPSLNCFLHK